MFVQLDVPAELHRLQLSLLSFAPLSFRPGLQFVNKVLTSDLLPEVLCRSLLQIQLRFSLPPQNKVSGNMEQHLIQLPLQPSPQGSCAPLAVGIGLQEILRYMICVHAFCCLFTSHRFPSRLGLLQTRSGSSFLSLCSDQGPGSSPHPLARRLSVPVPCWKRVL